MHQIGGDKACCGCGLLCAVLVRTHLSESCAVCSVAFLCALLLPFSSFAFCIVCLQPGTRSNMRGETVWLRGSGNVCAVSPEATPRRDESSIIA